MVNKYYFKNKQKTFNFLVVEKIKEILNNRGEKALRTFSKTLRSYPSFDGDKSINKNDFFQALVNKGITLSKNDIDV